MLKYQILILKDIKINIDKYYININKYHNKMKMMLDIK